jgi:hypothetical protein
MMSSLSQRTSESSNLVCWTFIRQGTALTCHVNARTRSSFDVCIVADGDVSAASVETLSTVGRALRRHAEIAKELRESGWHVVQRTAC